MQTEKQKKYTIELVRVGCIECGACAKMAPKFWEMDKKDDKANLKNATERRIKDNVVMNETIQTDDIKGYDGYFQSAKCCPVRVIHIIDNETGKKIEIYTQKVHELK